MNTKVPPSSKVLVVVRHAHRDKEMAGLADNGLSEKGLKQAERIKKFFFERWDNPKEWEFHSSPKKRCQETISKIAHKAGKKLVVDPLLDEGASLEARVFRFFEWWEHEASKFTMVCSHGDWIPEFMDQVLKQHIDLKKGAWAELVLDRGKVSLTWLVQEFEG